MKPQTDRSEVRDRQILEALEEYDCRVSDTPARVADSVRNENYRVSTDRGTVFVRFYRPSRTIDRIRREHRVIQWAAAEGLPVVPPMPRVGGGTLHELNGRFVAVFPWMAGHSLQRGQITLPQAAAMGSMHGQLHSVLLRFPDGDVPWFWDPWGETTDPSGELLAQLLQRLPEFDLTSDEVDLIGRTMEMQLGLLKAVEPPTPSPLSPGVQPVHGDYHERNIRVDSDDSVVAVVDWDMVARMPRAFELVRSLSFAELLESPLLEAYLTAYRDYTTLTAAECSAAVELWWKFLVHDTWLYSNRLLKGDSAVHRFFPEQIGRMQRFGERSFRAHLAGELKRLAGPR